MRINGTGGRPSPRFDLEDPLFEVDLLPLPSGGGDARAAAILPASNGDDGGSSSSASTCRSFEVKAPPPAAIKLRRLPFLSAVRLSVFPPAPCEGEADVILEMLYVENRLDARRSSVSRSFSAARVLLTWGGDWVGSNGGGGGGRSGGGPGEGDLGGRTVDEDDGVRWWGGLLIADGVPSSSLTEIVEEDSEETVTVGGGEGMGLSTSEYRLIDAGTCDGAGCGGGDDASCERIPFLESVRTGRSWYRDEDAELGPELLRGGASTENPPTKSPSRDELDGVSSIGGGGGIPLEDDTLFECGVRLELVGLRDCEPLMAGSTISPPPPPPLRDPVDRWLFRVAFSDFSLALPPLPPRSAFNRR